MNCRPTAPLLYEESGEKSTAFSPARFLFCPRPKPGKCLPAGKTYAKI